jgi:hypothetical protein
MINARAAEMPLKSLRMKMAITILVKVKNLELPTWNISKI